MIRNNNNYQTIGESLHIMFKYAMVKKPCPNISRGITSADLGTPDYNTSQIQHNHYIQTLEACGLNVTVLPEDNLYPDSTFIEDTALVTGTCAIITNPGAESRNGETKAVCEGIKQFFPEPEFIQSPGTLDAGDVMMAGKHFYIGLSERTNQDGANQLIKILNKYGYTGSTVTLKYVLHLKTGISYLEHNILLAAGEFIEKKEFSHFTIIPVDENEQYAANSVWVNDHVIVPEGYPETQKKIEAAGYHVFNVDVSEFRKLDGGLSCLSLRF